MKGGSVKAWKAPATAIIIVALGAAIAAPFWNEAVFRAARKAERDRYLPAAMAATAPSPTEMNGAQPLAVPMELTLAGEVYGVADGAQISATVYVNGQAFNASVVGRQYTAAIKALHAGDMVTVEVVSPKVHYRAILGTYRKLKRFNGGDRRVDLAEYPALQVSPMSTATALLVNRVLGHEPQTDLEFDRATRALAARISRGSSYMVSDLTTTAKVLYDIAIGNMELPSGYGDGYAFVQDQAAYNAYLGTWDEKADLARTYPFDQADFVRLRSLSEIPSTLLLTTGWPQGNVPAGVGGTLMLVNATGNRYWLHGVQGLLNVVGQDTMTPAQLYDLSITASGELRLDAVNPTPVEGSSETATRIRRVVTGYTLRRLTVGDQFSLWASRAEWSDTLIDDPAQHPVNGSSTQVWTASDLDQMTHAAAWNGLQGRRGLPWFCVKSLPNRSETQLTACEWPQHRFDMGGTGVTEDVGPKVDGRMQPQAGGWGVSFSWSIDTKGRLRVVGPGVETLFWNIDAGDAAADVVVYLTRSASSNPADQSMVGVTLAISGDYMPLSSSQMIGSWELGSSVAHPFEYPAAAPVFVLQRNADGSGKDYTNVYGINDVPYLSNWQVAGERVFDTRYRAKFSTGPTRYVQTCEQAFAEGATGCSPNRVRYFRPLMRLGSRLYGIQEFYLQYPTVYAAPDYTGTYSMVRSGAITYYECVGGACLTAFPAAAQPVPAGAGSSPSQGSSRKPGKPGRANSPVSGISSATVRSIRSTASPAANARVLRAH